MIRNYLHFRRALFLFYLLSLVLGCLFWWLLGSDGQDVLYFALITSVPFFIIALYDFFRFQRKQKHLIAIRDSMFVTDHEFPEGDDALERAYHDIVTSLLSRLAHNMDQMERTHRRELDYFTMWAHQIKSPIFAMHLTLADGLQEQESDTAELRAQLFEIERYADMALQYVRSETLSQDLVIEPCALGDVVRLSLKRFAPLFIKKNLSLTIFPIEQTVTSDSKWLGFALDQIISNSIKYTNTGGITIRFTNHGLMVEDTGIGIHAEDLPRVFEHGYTGHNGRRNVRASGIGLYMAKRILTQLHVGISIDSQPMQGTVVRLVFSSQDEVIYE